MRFTVALLTLCLMPVSVQALEPIIHGNFPLGYYDGDPLSPTFGYNHWKEEDYSGMSAEDTAARQEEYMEYTFEWWLAESMYDDYYTTYQQSTDLWTDMMDIYDDLAIMWAGDLEYHWYWWGGEDDPDWEDTIDADFSAYLFLWDTAAYFKYVNEFDEKVYEYIAAKSAYDATYADATAFYDEYEDQCQIVYDRWVPYAQAMGIWQQ